MLPVVPVFVDVILKLSHGTKAKRKELIIL